MSADELSDEVSQVIVFLSTCVRDAVNDRIRAEAERDWEDALKCIHEANAFSYVIEALARGDHLE